MNRSFLLGAVTALVVSPLLLLAVPERRSAAPATAVSGCEGAPLESLMNRLAVAYPRRQLAELAVARPHGEPVQILVEHSLVGEMESELLPDLAAVDGWLAKRLPDEPRVQSARPLLACGKGLCTFDFFDGINHRTLYLHHVLYGCRGGQPVIKALGLLDGD